MRLTFSNFQMVFTGTYTVDDIQARRIAVAHALRQLADHLEATAPTAAEQERGQHGSYYQVISPLPGSITITTEKHDELGGRWIAKAIVEPAAYTGATERLSDA